MGARRYGPIRGIAFLITRTNEIALSCATIRSTLLPLHRAALSRLGRMHGLGGQAAFRHLMVFVPSQGGHFIFRQNIFGLVRKKDVRQGLLHAIHCIRHINVYIVWKLGWNEWRRVWDDDTFDSFLQILLETQQPLQSPLVMPNVYHVLDIEGSQKDLYNLMILTLRQWHLFCIVRGIPPVFFMNHLHSLP